MDGSEGKGKVLAFLRSDWTGLDWIREEKRQSCLVSVTVVVCWLNESILLLVYFEGRERSGRSGRNAIRKKCLSNSELFE